MDPLLLPISDTCRVLGVGRSKIYQLINDGQIAIVKIGRRTLIRVSSIEELADKGVPNAAA